MESEERYGVAVLRALDVEPTTASRVDVSRAVSDGRRRRLIRRWARIGGCAAVTAVAVASVPLVAGALRGEDPTVGDSIAATPPPATQPAVTPPTACTVSRLPIPGGHPMALVTGADPTGRLLLGRAYPEGNKGRYPVVIWENGVPRTVDVPGADQALRDANTAGVAVGSGWGDAGPVPYVYRDGKVSVLPGVPTGEAVAINEAGVIIGQSSGSPDSAPVVWRSATEPATYLPMPSGWTGNVVAVGEDGSVLALLRAAGRKVPQAYLWGPDGRGRTLPKPSENEYFRPYSIQRNLAYGVAYSEEAFAMGGRDRSATPVRLDLTTGQYTRLPDVPMIPSDANGSGWLVGSNERGQAAMSAGKGMITLPDLDNHKSSTANIASTVSEDGRIVAGQADDANEVIQPVVWNCQ
ncbi:hypothetical protein K1W54_41345 [Micromonospora sp. CPCC 205371]|nr:hypothetical protein [Micromonospora sp. CPCC 205371]